MNNIIVVTNALGELGTNCYTVVNTDTRQAVIIDPAANSRFLCDMIENQNYILTGLLLTHGHVDHIGAISGILEKYPEVKVFCAEEEVEVLRNPNINLSSMFGQSMSFEADVKLKNNQVIDLIGADMTCIHTPGHTGGGMCFYFKESKLLFSGDTLFEESVGRTDFPTGDGATLVKSIRERLFSLPEDVVVYPGHGGKTTIGNEKRYNPYAGSGL